MRFFYFLLLVSLCSTTSLSAQDCDHPDYAALMALYEATDGDNWVNSTGWSDGAAGNNCEPCSGWEGVYCNDEGRVRYLFLFSNNLSGELPAEISTLTGLEWFFLSDNNLEGTLPSTIGSLQNLRFLIAADNNLTSPLPESFFSLSNLERFSLSSNPFNNPLPPEIGQLSSLKQLYLYNSGVNGNLPPEIGQLTAMEYLMLRENDITGAIPEEIGNLVSLRSLFLGSNEISGPLPNSMANLALLEDLFAGNNLSGNIPSWLAELTNLRRCFLTGDGLSGPIPEQIGTLPLLNSFSIVNASLEGGIPPSFTTLPNLNFLQLVNCDLSGPIPEGFGALNLQSLNIADNNFSGCIPEDLSVYCNATGVNFFLLTNPLLPWEGNTTEFCAGTPQIGAPCDDGIPDNGPDVINEDCSCGDYVPPIDCDHPDYEALEAIYHALSGENWNNNSGWLTDCEPCQWFGISCNSAGRVRRLKMPDNNLVGVIPPAIADLKFLSRLEFSSNDIDGYLPYDLEGHPNLRYLDLSYCYFYGGIPPEFGDIPKLTVLNLRGNRLDGEIAEELGDLEYIRGIDASDNQLQGSLDENLAGFANTLEYLNLKNNNLSGCFPEELEAWCQIQEVNLLGNPLLPWQGNFQNFCWGFNQMGASCDDGDSETVADQIGADCSCLGIGEENDDDDNTEESCASEVGKPCDDGNPRTEGEIILEDCSCGLKDPKSTARTTTSLLVYPNPVTEGWLNVEFPQVNVTVRLIAPDGREVSRLLTQKTSVSIPTSGLSPGFYILSVESSEDRWVQKVIIK